MSHRFALEFGDMAAQKLHSMFVKHNPDLYGIDCNFDADGKPLPSMTRQDMSDECDLNKLMARYEKAGEMLVGRQDQPTYLDLTDMPIDFHSAMDGMLRAQEAFMTLPAIVRREFDNDPVKFVDFAVDEKNLDRMRDWGLAPPAPVEKPVLVDVVEKPKPKAAAPEPTQ